MQTLIRHGGRTLELTPSRTLLPDCARCGKPVEAMVSMEEFDTFHFAASCHGEEQHSKVTRTDLVWADYIVIGPAFSEPLIHVHPTHSPVASSVTEDGSEQSPVTGTVGAA